MSRSGGSLPVAALHMMAQLPERTKTVVEKPKTVVQKQNTLQPVQILTIEEELAKLNLGKDTVVKGDINAKGDKVKGDIEVGGEGKVKGDKVKGDKVEGDEVRVDQKEDQQNVDENVKPDLEVKSQVDEEAKVPEKTQEEIDAEEEEKRLKREKEEEDRRLELENLENKRKMFDEINEGYKNSLRELDSEGFGNIAQNPMGQTQMMQTQGMQMGNQVPNQMPNQQVQGYPGMPTTQGYNTMAQPTSSTMAQPMTQPMTQSIYPKFEPFKPVPLPNINSLTGDKVKRREALQQELKRAGNPILY
jgi:hypothetical protein